MHPEGIPAAAPLPNPSSVTPWPDDSVGRIMDEPVAVFPPDMLVAAAIEEIRRLAKERFFTYAYICGMEGRLVGVVTMRDLLLAEPRRFLEEIMLRQPFALRPEMPVLEAMRLTASRHYPSYPVCDASGRLLGLVRGATLFERQTFEISAQAGAMVGVEKEERITTPWWRSFLFRHPWLQLNLLTTFIAAGVVGYFEDTIARIVALAVFLPVLTSQSANTGCQALAVALRGITLGEFKEGHTRGLCVKETLLGLFNGIATGLAAAAGMVAYAYWKETPESPWALGAVVFLAMVASCLVSGVCGALTPLVLRRLGADPATASSIFLTTATDVASMALFLGLAALWLM